MTNNLYNYKATVVRILDGDTVELMIHLGFTIVWKSSCRLYGINTPELNSKDPLVRAKALEAKQYLIDRLPAGSIVYVTSRELDKYGRPLADVYYSPENKHLNQELVDGGLAVKYIL
jgi:micrococcal nuclease